MESFAEETTRNPPFPGKLPSSGPGKETLRQRFRSEIRVRWPEWATLSLYAAVVALAIPYHEPWTDEAQSWQLARSLPLSSLFKTYIRYEGSPGLWHFFLWVLIRGHVSYAGLHWICGVIALAASALLVFASPLPRYLRLSIPFTYFLLFQFSVIARNYVLIPILLFLVAYYWRKRPVVVFLLLGLLANTALHAAVISGGLALVFVIELLRNPEFEGLISRPRLLLYTSALTAFYAFAIWTAFPPHDLALSRVRGESRTLITHMIVSLVWGMCEPSVLSIPFWAIITACFVSRHKFLYLLPVLFFALFSGEVYANWWHVGLLVPTLVSLLWITWPAPGTANSRMEKIGRFTLAFMIATQIIWSCYALVYDHYRPYSPDPAAAAYLKPLVKKGDRIAITFIDNQGNHAYDGVGILPYFDHNIYVNQANSFWWWSDLDTTEDKFNAILPTHPDIVLVEVRYKNPPDQVDLNQPRYESIKTAGYRFAKAYCGTFPVRLEEYLTNCHVIFEYANGVPSPADSQRYVPISR